MERFKNILGIVAIAIFVLSIISSCSQEKEKVQKPLTMEEIRADFLKDVKEEVNKTSVVIDVRVEGTTLYMIDRSETGSGLNSIVQALKKRRVWTEDPKNTLGHLGSSLMKLGFTHFVSWGSKDKKNYTYELKKKS